MKNVKYWLETIPDPEVRAKALANYNSDDCEGCHKDDADEMSSLAAALIAAFRWRNAPEGEKYWVDYHDNLEYL